MSETNDEMDMLEDLEGEDVEEATTHHCPCSETTSSSVTTEAPPCVCPRAPTGEVAHEEPCLMNRMEKLIYPHEVTECECTSPRFASGVCECCACLPNQCVCPRSGPAALEEWRRNRPLGEMPAVLEATHPLMQKFQITLKNFLEKENSIAEEEITKLRDELKNQKRQYDTDLETIYRDDHDTNAQRTLIVEYEKELSKKRSERQEMEERLRLAADEHRGSGGALDDGMMREREAHEELTALNSLVKQLEQWRQETESGLTISHRMSDKMKQEKKVLADEKRQLDMILLALSNEVWKLESRMEMFQKQIEIKTGEMSKVNDKVTVYATELEDLELDKRRLVGLWNSVIVNIKQRDKVYNSVRDDYNTLQDNYSTVVTNLESTKKSVKDEMQISRGLAMDKDKLDYDLNNATKAFETEDTKKNYLEAHIIELTESIELTEKDHNMIKVENSIKRNVLKGVEKELDRRHLRKSKLENEILLNLQDCLLNDKAASAMAAGIRKMREMSTKLEISLMQLENAHAKIMLDIEVYRHRQTINNQELSKHLDAVGEVEKEMNEAEAMNEKRTVEMSRRQRELDLMLKKYAALKELFDMKSPQERRISELELQIRALRDKTEVLQHEWLRQQGHVVRLTQQHQKSIADINLLAKQNQICEQKVMHVQADIEKIQDQRSAVERALRSLQGQLELLERTRKAAGVRNLNAQRANVTITQEYAASLKNAETDIIQIEEEIESLEKEKVELTQALDKVQREALIWQRKGILAVELKRNIKNAQSAAGDIGQMKSEIHRMEVRNEQLRRTGEKLSGDLAQYVTRRSNVLEKTRANAAVGEARGAEAVGRTTQAAYHHRLRLARADVTRVTKELSDAQNQLEHLESERERLEREADDAAVANAKLEESVADLMRETRRLDRQRQWVLERVVRRQRLAGELTVAVKRQSLKIKKPKASVLAEYDLAVALNDRIRFIVESLARDYPYMEEQFEGILNTLNIYSPDHSPRLTRDGPEGCVPSPVQEEAEQPFEDTPICGPCKIPRGQMECTHADSTR